jgi:hypothetical protein
MTVRILIGDSRQRLKELPDESVHCVVTSPPYWGLRDYGVDGQIGLEASPSDFIEEMVSLFRECRRVLRADGTCWMNMGDSYAGSGRGGNPTEATSGLEGGQASQRASMVKRTRAPNEIGSSARDAAVTNIGRRALRNEPSRFTASGEDGRIHTSYVPAPIGLKQKDLMGMPWRVALALQADGWWLRQDIIWSKPNPMPESVTDRCTKSHEYIFLLTKSSRYHFDQTAILEPVSANTHARLAQDVAAQIGSERAHAGGKTNGKMKAVGRQKMAAPGSGVKNNESFASAVCLPGMRNNFTKATQREAFTRSKGICECHRLARAGVPGFSVDGCGVQLGIGNTFYEHVNPDALSKDNSLDNAAALSRTCWKQKTATYDLPVIARTKRIEDDARGIKDPWKQKLPGGRTSFLKKKLNGQVVIRATGERA